MNGTLGCESLAVFNFFLWANTSALRLQHVLATFNTCFVLNWYTTYRMRSATPYFRYTNNLFLETKTPPAYIAHLFASQIESIGL